MTTNVIITGAIGSGKSTVLKLLQAQGFLVVEEPARKILAEQRRIGDEGVPEKNPKLFTQLLLSHSIYQYTEMQRINGLVIYDRGIPDNIAYAQLFQLNYLPAHKAAKLYRYHTQVFIFPAWRAIYTTDEERKMSFEAAEAFGKNIGKIYQEYGYSLIEVPCVSPEKRLQFIRDTLSW